MAGEVRRCARCGAAAAVARQTYEGAVSVLGFSTPTGQIAREDFVCQRCGAGFVLEAPRKRLFVALIFGMPTLGIGPCLVFMGLTSMRQGDAYAWVAALVGLGLVTAGGGLAWWAAQPARMWRIHPVVPGAPRPELRFDVPREPARRCACGAAASVVTVTQHQSRGISQGRTLRYGCPRCGKTFRIEDALSTALLLLGGVVFAAIGAGMAMHAAGNGAFAWVCSSVVSLFGVLGFVMTIAAIVSRLRHPVAR